MSRVENTLLLICAMNREESESLGELSHFKTYSLSKFDLRFCVLPAAAFYAFCTLSGHGSGSVCSLSVQQYSWYKVKPKCRVDLGL